MVQAKLNNTWKRKVLSILMIAVMAVTSIPVAMLFTGETVHAATVNYSLMIQDGKLLQFPNSEKPVNLDGVSLKGNVLTFDNFNFTTSSDPGLLLRDAGDFTIVLKGNNTITAQGSSSKSSITGLSLARSSNEMTNVTFKGNGKLTVNVDPKEGQSTAIYANGDIIASENVKIIANAGKSRSSIAVNNYHGSFTLKDNAGIKAKAVAGGESVSAAFVARDTLNFPSGIDPLYRSGSKYVVGKVGKVPEGSYGAGQSTVLESDGKTPAVDVLVGMKDETPTPPPAKKLAAPKTIAAKGIKTSTIKVAWSKVSGATSYLLYTSASKNGTYNLIETVKGTSKTMDYFQANKTFYFKVRAKNAAGISGYSKVASAKAAKEVSNSIKCTCGQDHSKAWFTLKQSGKSNVKVQWKTQKGAKQYQVANNHTGNKAMKIKWTGNNSQHTYLSMGKSKGKNYQFKMRTVTVKNGKKVYGPWSSKVCITMK